ncbi:MAG: hypothetical protein WCR26_03290 [Sphaerochaetaceae bacterium]|jgi:hypothetical protein
MNGTKKPWESKTVWASIVVMILGVMSAMSGTDWSVFEGELTELIMNIMVTISGVIAFWGRLKARKEIK